MSVALRIAPLVFVAAVLQVSAIGGARILGAEPDLLLVTVVAVGLVAGSIPGACAGFAAGLLFDVMTLGVLGTTAIILTPAGYWAGRYGETTARDRFHAPFTSVAVITVLYSFGALALRFVLGDSAPAGDVASGLPATIALNLLLTWPVYTLVRRLLPPRRPG